MFESKATILAIIIFLFFGLILGFVYEIFKLPKRLFKESYFINIISDFAFCLIAGFVYIKLLFKFQSGSFELYSLMVIIIGIIFQQIFISNLFAKGIKIVYNKHKIRKKHSKTKEDA